MKKASHNARLKNLTDRILQLCASNGVSIAWNHIRDGGDGFAFVPHDKEWDKALRNAEDRLKAEPKDDVLLEAAREGFGPDVSEGRA